MSPSNILYSNYHASSVSIFYNILLYRWASQEDTHHFNVGVIFSTPVSNNKSPGAKKRHKATRFNLPKEDQPASGAKEKSIMFSKHISTSLEIFPTRRMSKVSIVCYFLNVSVFKTNLHSFDYSTQLQYFQGSFMIAIF